MTLTDLIEEVERDEDTCIRKRLRKIKWHFANLQVHLITNDFSPQKIEDIITTTRGFYKQMILNYPNACIIDLYQTSKMKLSPPKSILIKPLVFVT
jgi:hypothetical protein